jgi:hypothetical protein
MNNHFDAVHDSINCLIRAVEKLPEWNRKILEASLNEAKSAQIYWNAILKYTNEFMAPYWTALKSFSNLEKIKALDSPPEQTARDYLELLQFNIQIANKGLANTFRMASDYHSRKMYEFLAATLNTFLASEGEDIAGYTDRQLRLLDLVVNVYPKAIRDIKAEYGFHFESGGYSKVAETDRFELYQVFPLDKAVQVREDGKPIMIVPPYVLGANILAFLPAENKSYVHCYANQGIPTYIRILKDIDTTPAVQTMTGEDDARDTRYFCEQLKARHGRPVTLNGYCQGGFISVANLLSGELDGLVDALITCVAPMDGTRSKSLVEYLSHLPPRFRDLGYALKTLPNGNQVVDGKVMSWVYKLKSIETEAPIFTFYRDLLMFDRSDGKPPEISKTAAAVNHWLLYDQKDIPRAITQMSFDSYTIPVSEDGTLPVKLFGRPLNFKRLKEMGIQWLICIGESDDLVDERASLAALDFVEAEVSVFPKGHGAIATSWSMPTSACALHSCFVHKSSRFDTTECRGPVRFQLDLQDAGNDVGYTVNG